MKFLADENIPYPLIKEMRKNGYSVRVLKEENLSGTDDQNIANLSKEEGLIIMTFDKDFTDLEMFPLEKHAGVVVLRYKNKHPKVIIPRVLQLLNSATIKRATNSLIEIFDGYVKVTK